MPAAAPLDAFSLRGTLSIAALGLLGYAIAIANGTLQPTSFWLTALALGLACVAFVVPERELRGRLGVVPILLTFALFSHAVGVHLTNPAGVYLRGAGDLYTEHHFVFAAVALLGGGLLLGPRSAMRWAFPLLLVIYLWLGRWLLKASPSPHIDVWVWHNAAFDALRRGISPYAITIPNIYGNLAFYGEGVADNSRVYIGYPYPPLSLLLGGIGQLLGDDYRYFNLLAQTATAGLLYYARPSRMSALAAALFLFTPRDLFVLEQGWTDTQSALAVAACVFCALRAPRALPWVFGALLAIKQYFIFAVPLVPLLIDSRDPRVIFRFLLKAAVIPLITYAPFVIWDAKGFINSVVMFQVRQPFRVDALSVMAWLAARGGPMLPLNISFVLALAAIVIALWRSERSPSGFAAALSTTLLFFFFFAKQAFANYYYLTLACLAATAATSLAPARQPDLDSSPPM